MTSKTLWTRGLFLAATLMISQPAFGWDYFWECRNQFTTWGSSTVTFRPRLDSFPAGSGWRTALESARSGWNDNSPNGQFHFNFDYQTGDGAVVGDGVNNIAVVNDAFLGGALGVTLTLANKRCRGWPHSRPKIAESDIIFGPDFIWDHATRPDGVVNCTPPIDECTFSSTIVALHEMGHSFGLDHEDGTLGTMDAIYPDGGPLGNSNHVHPHADDVVGNIGGYGLTPFFGPWQRDVAAHAFRRTGAGTSAPIPAPNFDRGVVRTVQFSIENRSIYSQNNVRVNFYLSTNDFISTSDIYVGSSTLNMPGFFTGTLTANVTVPASVNPGNYFFGWKVDANSQISEFSESNNAVAYQQRSTVTSSNVPPTACFTASPNSGEAPLNVILNASCSSDPDGTISQYTWNLGNGSTRTGQTTTAYYSEAGFYQVNLTVRDNNGATRTTSRFIDVFGDCGEPGTICQQ